MNSWYNPTLSCLILMELLLSLVEGAPPSGSFGTRFVLYAVSGTQNAREKQPHKSLGVFRISVTPYDLRGSYIKATCPICSPGDGFKGVDKYIPYGESGTVTVDRSFNTAIQLEAGRFNTTILLESSFLVTVMVTSNYFHGFLDTFLALPVQELDNKYVLTNHKDNSFAAIIAVEPGKTKVTFGVRNPSRDQGSSSSSSPDCASFGVYTSVVTIDYVLEQFQVMALFCNYYTGSYVYGSQKLAVMFGNYDVNLQTSPPTPGAKRLAHFQEQAVPSNACGFQFVVPGDMGGEYPIPLVRVVACQKGVSLTYDQQEETLETIGDYSDILRGSRKAYLVECSRGCHVTLMMPVALVTDPGVGTMLQLVSVHHFSSIYTFSAAKAKTGFGETFIMMLIVLESSRSRLCVDDVCNVSWFAIANLGWSDRTIRVAASSWRVLWKIISAGFHTAYHLDEETFGLYLMRKDTTSLTLTAAGISLSAELCRNTVPKIDDKLDNDCDGNVDEELKNSEDDDYDGRIDEDLRSLPELTLRNGNWGQWTAWECDVKCEGWGKYRRFRLCNRPAPIGEGSWCPGHNQEMSGLVCDLEKVPCPKACPATVWGVNCDQLCPPGCLNQRCDKETGDCLGCEPGKEGRKCVFECPRFKYGTNCSQSCTDVCSLSDCHPVTGECDIGLSLIPFILLCLGLSIIPAVLICAVVCWYRQSDPERLKMLNKLHQLDLQISRARILMEAKQMDEGYSDFRRRRSTVTGRFRSRGAIYDPDVGSNVDGISLRERDSSSVRSWKGGDEADEADEAEESLRGSDGNGRDSKGSSVSPAGRR